MRLRLEALSKRFHDANRELTVIADLFFEVPAAASIAIVGRSGVGKSTLLHLLGGLIRPTAGAIYYDKLNICKLSSDELSAWRGRQVGFVFQFHQLLPDFSAWENVAMPLWIAGIEERAARRQALDLLTELGLADRAEHRPGELSGGEQQRVALARAMINRPAVILADEPTGNLDLETAADIQDLMLAGSREQGAKLIVVTHSLELARCMDLTLEMQPGGRLVELS